MNENIFTQIALKYLVISTAILFVPVWIIAPIVSRYFAIRSLETAQIAEQEENVGYSVIAKSAAFIGKIATLILVLHIFVIPIILTCVL